MRVILYTRVSTDEQGNNFSLSGQMHELRQHAAKNGYEVVAEIVDKGERRKNLYRPGLNEIRDLIQTEHVDEVWAWAWDRFSESPWDQVLSLEMAGYDVALRSLDDGGPGEDAAFLRGIKGLLSKQDQQKRVDRTRMGKNSRARRGEVVPSGNNLPYGFDYNETRTNYVVNPDEMGVVRRMYKDMATGSSLSGLCNALDADGIPTPRDQGYWKPITARRMLLKDLYMPHTADELLSMGVGAGVVNTLDPEARYGVWWYGETRITSSGKGKKRDDAIPVPIPLTDAIPREWVEATRRYFDTYRGWRDKPGSHFYELRGMVYCGGCGKRMTGAYNHGYFYYSCQDRRNYGKKACPESKNHRADGRDGAERLIMRRVESLLQNPDRVRQHLDAAIAAETQNTPRAESAAWIGVIEKCGRKRAGYLDLAADGLMDKAELKEKLTALDNERETAEKHLRDARDGESRVTELKATKRTLLNLYAEGILYDGLFHFTAEMRHQIYDALGVRVVVETDKTLTIDLDVNANALRLTQGAEQYAKDQDSSRGLLTVRGIPSDTAASIVVMKCSGESWRPRGPAASTNVATTPARIADGGAPATTMYSHVRTSVAKTRALGGTARYRRAKKRTAARTATCWPEMARTCVLVPRQTERGFRFSARLDGRTPATVRFERAAG